MAMKWLVPHMRGVRAPLVHPRPDDDAVALNLNECPLPPSPRAIAAAVATIAGANRYPPTDGSPLIAALAAHSGVPAERIEVAVGSDMLLHLLCMVSLMPGRSAVLPFPSFPRFSLSSRIAGGRPIPVDVGADGANDVERMLAAIAPDTSVLFCCTPNGNTGGAMSATALRRLALGVQNDVLLVVDEAYAEFDPAADTLAVLANRRGPWAVTRTFSKAYALAGLRVGYALCSDRRIAEVLHAARPIFEMTSPALAAAAAALGDTGHLQRILQMTEDGRNHLVAGLRALGFTPLPSVANFVTTDLHRAAAPIRQAMSDAGVPVRGLPDPGYENFLRITVGLPEQNARALAALAAALRKNSADG